MRITRAKKIIQRLEGLTEQEKKKFIRIGTIEEVLNGYKLIFKIPLLLISYLFIIVSTLFLKISELLELITTVNEELINFIDNHFTIQIAKKQDIERLVKIIKEENNKKYSVK